MVCERQRKNVTLVAAVLGIYVVDFAINAGMYKYTSMFLLVALTDLL